VTGYIPRWFTRPQTVTHPSTNPAVHGRELNSRPVDHKSDALSTTPPNHLNKLIDEYVSAPTFSKVVPNIFPKIFLSLVTCDFLRKILIQILDAVLTVSKSGIALS